MADFHTVIIGSGAGGATVAKRLAETQNEQILVIERGTAVPREDRNWDPDTIFSEKDYQTEEKWRDKDGESFKPEAYFVIGGNTKFFGAALQRMREVDFGEVQHHGGVSPAWPLDYGVFEPYYQEAEKLFKIHGVHGEEPTEPWRSEPYPYTEIPHEPRIAEVAEDLRGQGLKPFHLPLAIDRNVSSPEEGKCIRCETCDPYPCKIEAKLDAEIACLIPALSTGKVTLWSGTKVLSLETDSSGSKVVAALVEHEGKKERVTGDKFVISAGAINSAALLLRSKSEAHPDGLGNQNGLVGRRLMFHNHSGITAVDTKENDTVFQKTLGFHDYYFKGPEGYDYPLGGIQLTGKAPWQRLATVADPSTPREMLEHMAKHAIDWWVTSEDLPDDDNRVSVGADGQIEVCFTPNNLKPHNDLIRIWIDHLRRRGDYLFMTKTMPLPTVWHQAGTCVFGVEEKKSVLNLQCRLWGVENCYVVDSSFMPCMGAVNPTLTIIANALRVADTLAGLAAPIEGGEPKEESYPNSNTNGNPADENLKEVKSLAPKDSRTLST